MLFRNNYDVYLQMKGENNKQITIILQSDFLKLLQPL